MKFPLPTGPHSTWFIFFVFAAPILGWFSFLAMMVAVLLGLFNPSFRAGAWQAEATHRALVPIVAFISVMGATQWIHGIEGRGWMMAQYLIPLLMPLALYGRLKQVNLDASGVASWARFAVWLVVLVTGVEYAVYTFVMGVEGHRARFFSANPLFVSVMLVPMMYLSFLDLASASQRQRWSAAAGFVAGMLALAAFMGARASLLISILLLPLLGWHAVRAKAWPGLSGRTLSIIGLVLMAVAMSTYFLSPVFLDRLQEVFRFVLNPDAAVLASKDFSMYLRWVNWQSAIQAFMDSPWLGYGFLNELHALSLHNPEKSQVLGTAHQQYLSFALAAGWPGLLVGIGFFALPAWLLWSQGFGQLRLYAALSLLCPFMLNGLTDTTFDDLRILSYYLVMTLTLAAVRFDECRSADDHVAG